MQTLHILTNPADISFENLLECDYQQLKEIYINLVNTITEANKESLKQVWIELLQLMEGAPEIQESIKAIRIDCYKEWQENTGNLKNRLTCLKKDKADWLQRLERLNHEHEQFEEEKNKKQAEISGLSQKLEKIKKMIIEIQDNKKSHLMSRYKRLNALIEEENKGLEEQKKKWRGKKDQVLSLTRDFSDHCLRLTPQEK